MIVNIQFSDSTEQVIVSYFAGPQDPDVFQNLGTVDTSDARWKTYYDSQPAPLQSCFPAPTEA